LIKITFNAGYNPARLLNVISNTRHHPPKTLYFGIWDVPGTGPIIPQTFGLYRNQEQKMKSRTLSLIAGTSYLTIFLAAVYANFFVLESLSIEPLNTIQENPLMVRIGILAFLVTVVFDVVVAWALYELYKNHHLSGLSTYFRMMHAAIMGVAIFALPAALTATSSEEILRQVELFNIIWLIGLFFFGIHLILLGNIIGKPRIIALFLIVAGLMYMIDTVAHFLLPDYDTYASLFLALVAIPSVIGEMSFSIWLLIKGGKSAPEPNNERT